jgi:hypothetical protein
VSILSIINFNFVIARFSIEVGERYMDIVPPWCSDDPCTVSIVRVVVRVIGRRYGEGGGGTESVISWGTATAVSSEG